MYQVWLKSLDIYSGYRPETKIWACIGQITPSKFDEICPLAISNQISTISMHMPSLLKIHWCLLKLSSGNENMGVSWTDNSVRFNEICPLAVPNQISTISVHIPNLVKIHWCLLELSSRNEIWTDGHTDIQHETIILRHYLVTGYKKGYQETIFFLFLHQKHTLQSLYNTVHYNTVLDITGFKDGSQKCIDCIEKWP